MKKHCATSRQPWASPPDYQVLLGWSSALAYLGGVWGPLLPRSPQVALCLAWCQACRGDGWRDQTRTAADLLRKIKGVWDPRAGEADVVMLWAACCLAYFGFMRIGELTVPSDGASAHLSWGDIMVDDPACPSRMEVRIKASKTDPFRQGISLFIGKVASARCRRCWLTWL